LRLLYWHSDVKVDFQEFCTNITSALSASDKKPSGFKALTIGGTIILADYVHKTQFPEGRIVVITPEQIETTEGAKCINHLSIKAFTMQNNKPENMKQIYLAEETPKSIGKSKALFNSKVSQLKSTNLNTDFFDFILAATNESPK
jgi:hypothetical protein